MRSSSGGGRVSSWIAEEDGCSGLGSDGNSSAGSAIDMLRPRVQQQQQIAGAVRLPSNYCAFYADVLYIPLRFDWVIDEELFQTKNGQKPFFRSDKYKSSTPNCPAHMGCLDCCWRPTTSSSFVFPFLSG